VADPYKIRLVPYRVLVGRLVPNRRAEAIELTPSEVYKRFALGGADIGHGAFLAVGDRTMVLFLGPSASLVGLERKHPGFADTVREAWRVELPPRGRMMDTTTENAVG
jgi:hypothetical protein